MDKNILAIIKKYLKIDLTEKEIDVFLSCFLNNDWLWLDFIKYTKKTIENLNNEKECGCVFYFPCHSLELRNILHSKKITSKSFIGIYNSFFAKKYINAECFIGIDTSKVEEPVVKHNNLLIFNPNLDISKGFGEL